MDKYFLFYVIGCILGIFWYYLLYDSRYADKIIESTKKPTIDYKLQANNKQVDTIWIYTFKKH